MKQIALPIPLIALPIGVSSILGVSPPLEFHLWPWAFKNVVLGTNLLWHIRWWDQMKDICQCVSSYNIQQILVSRGLLFWQLNPGHAPWKAISCILGTLFSYQFLHDRVIVATLKARTIESCPPWSCMFSYVKTYYCNWHMVIKSSIFAKKYICSETETIPGTSVKFKKILLVPLLIQV